MKRNEWLKGLKAGDKVACKGIRYKTDWSILIVEKITPKGMVKCSNGSLFNKDGECRISEWHTLTIEPVTDEILNSIKRRKMLNYVKEFKFEELDDVKLELIYNQIQIKI